MIQEAKKLDKQQAKSYLKLLWIGLAFTYMLLVLILIGVVMNFNDSEYFGLFVLIFLIPSGITVMCLVIDFIRSYSIVGLLTLIVFSPLSLLIITWYLIDITLTFKKMEAGTRCGKKGTHLLKST